MTKVRKLTEGDGTLYGCIYRITAPDKQIYIGQTTDIRDRIYHYRNYKCKNQNRLFESLKKYGWESHTLDMLIESHFKDRIEMFQLEIHFINIFGCNFTKTGWGLNLTDGGQGINGYKHRDNTKIMMSKNHSDVSGSNNPFYGKTHTKEALQKISIFNKNRVILDETKNKISKALKGRKKTQEEINKFIKSKSKPVICINTGVVYPSAKIAEEVLGLGHNVASVCKGVRKTAGKLKFEYLNK